MPIELNIELPGGKDRKQVVLADHRALLIGREPDPSLLTSASSPGAAETLRIAEPSVSANHLIVRCEGARASLVDLGSRNGTWLQLPKNDPIEISSSQPLHLRLSAQAQSFDRGSDPEDAYWTSAEDFHEGVAAALTRWLARQDVSLRVTARRGRRSEGVPAGGSELPLANGHTLQVIPLRTVDGRGEQMLETVWRYVAAQNALFEIEQHSREEGMLLASPAIRRAHRQVVDAAQRGLRLLLIGPSGAGKEELARCYHRHSGRSGPFVSRNCSMFTRELLRSELFGAEPGAFTSATSRIEGAVARAHGGTLFLDEIGDMPAEVQPQLLTFLDCGEYERLGSYGRTRRSDVRIVSATNRDLRAATLREEFRQDLWYRVAVCVVDVPPLRERLEDVIAYLKNQPAEDGLDLYATLDDRARARVHAHAWDGNFRELASFAALLPRARASGSIDERTCCEVLNQLSLKQRPAQRMPKLGGPLDCGGLAHLAQSAFDEDHPEGLDGWDGVKIYLEQYFKPLMFAQMSRAFEFARIEDVNVPKMSENACADRGTTRKQLQRYFERFLSLK